MDSLSIAGVHIEEESIEVDVRMYSEASDLIPKYESDHAAGFDLKANLPDNTKVIIPAAGKSSSLWSRIWNKNSKVVKNWELIPTGTRVELSPGYELQIRPRSGLALKHGVSIMNTPGTIDADYRGDIGVILVNHGVEPFEVVRGMKIAQAVLSKVERMNRVPVRTAAELSITKRGEGGFGHTGV